MHASYGSYNGFPNICPENGLKGGGFKHYHNQTILDGGDFTNYGTGESISGALFTDEFPEHVKSHIKRTAHRYFQA